MAWFIVPYKRRLNTPFPSRYPAIDDYTSQLESVGGKWKEIEILGNRCIVKVVAPQSALEQLATVFKRLPKDRLDDNLSDLPQSVRRALRDEILDQGYTLAELQAKFGNDLGQYTLREVLRFMATKRRKPRYDTQTDEIILDGPEQNCDSIDALEDFN
jgi:hypothetical protein